VALSGRPLDPKPNAGQAGRMEGEEVEEEGMVAGRAVERPRPKRLVCASWNRPTAEAASQLACGE